MNWSSLLSFTPFSIFYFHVHYDRMLPHQILSEYDACLNITIRCIISYTHVHLVQQGTSQSTLLTQSTRRSFKK